MTKFVRKVNNLNQEKLAQAVGSILQIVVLFPPQHQHQQCEPDYFFKPAL
jgi:hypothetical protein